MGRGRTRADGGAPPGGVRRAVAAFLPMVVVVAAG